MLLRSWLRTVDQLSHFWGAVLISYLVIFIASFFSLPTHDTWRDRFGNGLIGGLIALGLACGSLFVVNMWSYRHSGWKDEHWESTSDSTDAITFSLRYRAEATPRVFTEDDVMECRVLTPSGDAATVSDNELSIFRRLGVWMPGVSWREPGEYEVRWYLARSGKFCEVTRAIHTHGPYRAAALTSVFPDRSYRHQVRRWILAHWVPIAAGALGFATGCTVGWARIGKGKIVWGTVGEWVGGLGAALAVTWAVWAFLHEREANSRRHADLVMIVTPEVRRSADGLLEVHVSVLNSGPVPIDRVVVSVNINGVCSSIARRHHEHHRIDGGHRKGFDLHRDVPLEDARVDRPSVIFRDIELRWWIREEDELPKRLGGPPREAIAALFEADRVGLDTQ